jgi:hypothetical protein
MLQRSARRQYTSILGVLLYSLLPCCLDRYRKGDEQARAYMVQQWQLFDARAITAQAKAQHLNFFTDQIHFIPLVYEEFNTLLLNLLCDERNEFV